MPKPSPVLENDAIEEAFKPGGEVAEHWRSNLTLAREACQLTKAVLARKAGLDASEITRIENGQRTPSNATKCKISAALNMPVDRLFPYPTTDRINQMFLAEAAA